MKSTKQNKSDTVNFEQIRLKVGQKIQFSLVTPSKSINESKPQSYIATVIGYVPEIALITSMPLSDSLVGDPLIEGDQIHVRLFSGQSAYSFAASVDKIIKYPFKYIHLSFPENISSQNIRKSRRVRCHIPGQCSDAHKEITLTVTDVSVSGASIESLMPLGSLGSEIRLSFAVAILDEAIPLVIKGVIRSVKPMNKNGTKIICSGIEFVELEKKQQTALRHFIYQEIVERPDLVM